VLAAVHLVLAQQDLDRLQLREPVLAHGAARALHLRRAGGAGCESGRVRVWRGATDQWPWNEGADRQTSGPGTRARIDRPVALERGRGSTDQWPWNEGAERQTSGPGTRARSDRPVALERGRGSTDQWPWNEGQRANSRGVRAALGAGFRSCLRAERRSNGRPYSIFDETHNSPRQTGRLHVERVAIPRLCANPLVAPPQALLDFWRRGGAAGGDLGCGTGGAKMAC
jgi:hypothetical protein